MKTLPLLLAFLLGSDSDLVVHEWGTLLTMQGSDGVVLDGMYHEEHALPPFVHARGRDQLRLPNMQMKGETPVIYFYTGTRQHVWVTVGFPRGFWTQWYPQARVVRPQLVQHGTPPEPRDGSLQWEAEVLPPGRDEPALPPLAAGSLWRHAREVDAAFVKTLDRTRGGDAPPEEAERFLFYRGLGRGALPMRLEGDTLVWDAPEPARAVFVLRVEGDRGAFRHVPQVERGKPERAAVPALADARPLPEFAERLAGELAARFTECGLYAKEARALAETWRESWFQTEGVRVLFVLPRPWVDAAMPMQIAPEPKELVRVIVGRLEALTPERERAAAAAVADLAAPDATRRERGFDWLRAQGRYVEPVVRRVVATTGDPAVRALGRRLLLTDFVTDLRSALGAAAAPGGPLREEPAHVRAQLAVLLRESGLDAEARAEGKRALEELARLPEPPLDQDAARHHLRARARALEGTGDERGAAEAYGRLVRWAGRSPQCGACHAIQGPRDLAWFRDWWAGRRYSRLAAGAGRLDAEIAASEEALRRDGKDVGARLALAYLLEARGGASAAAAEWARLVGP